MNSPDDEEAPESGGGLRKTQSHGRIGEAAVAAKCWMHGIRAYNTGGLRANFAGSDLIIDTADPTRKRLVQVKTGVNAGQEPLLCDGEAALLSLAMLRAMAC